MAASTNSKFNMQMLRQQLNQLFASILPVAPPGTDKPARVITAVTRRRFFLGLAILLTGILLWQIRQPALELLFLVGDQEAVSAYLKSYGALGPLVLAVAQLVQVIIAFIPGHVFLIAAGYVYGFWPALVLNMVCIVAASQLAFALARWMGRPLVERLVDKDLLDRWYRIGEKQGFFFFTIAFVLPVFPTDAMNFVGGLSGISGAKFLAASILGRLPSAIILTMIGAYGLEFSRSTWGTIGALAGIALITGRILVARIEARHTITNQTEDDEQT